MSTASNQQSQATVASAANPAATPPTLDVARSPQPAGVVQAAAGHGDHPPVRHAASPQPHHEKIPYEQFVQVLPDAARLGSGMIRGSTSSSTGLAVPAAAAAAAAVNAAAAASAATHGMSGSASGPATAAAAAAAAGSSVHPFNSAAQGLSHGHSQGQAHAQQAPGHSPGYGVAAAAPGSSGAGYSSAISSSYHPGAGASAAASPAAAAAAIGSGAGAGAGAAGTSSSHPAMSNSHPATTVVKGVNMALATLVRKEDSLPAKPTVVLKIGSSSVMSADGQHPNLGQLARFAEVVCNLMRKNYNVIIVSSGAVSIGCQRLGLTERPKSVITKQAVAAVGQGRLMRLYDDMFSLMGQPIAQVLLSRENIAQEHHYRNALNTFRELMRLGVVTIVNENDTVAVDELRVGDNDTLSALVASIVRAHWLFLLTDVDALYDKNPRVYPDAKPIRVVHDIAELVADTNDAAGGAPGQSGKWGTGGMATKIQAATIATAAGVRTAICSTDRVEHLEMLISGRTDVGTQFVPTTKVITGHKKWIAQGLRPQGVLVIDDGATKSVIEKRSLFAAGIVDVLGQFPPHAGVKIVTRAGKELARGLVNYSSTEISIIKGLKSSQIAEHLGYNGPDVVIHRGNLVVFPVAMSPSPSSNALATFADAGAGAGAGAGASKGASSAAAAAGTGVGKQQAQQQQQQSGQAQSSSTKLRKRRASAASRVEAGEDESKLVAGPDASPLPAIRITGAVAGGDVDVDVDGKHDRNLGPALESVSSEIAASEPQHHPLQPQQPQQQQQQQQGQQHRQGQSVQGRTASLSLPAVGMPGMSVSVGGGAGDRVPAAGLGVSVGTPGVGATGSAADVGSVCTQDNLHLLDDEAAAALSETDRDRTDQGMTRPRTTQSHGDVDADANRDDADHDGLGALGGLGGGLGREREHDTESLPDPSRLYALAQHSDPDHLLMGISAQAQDPLADHLHAAGLHQLQQLQMHHHHHHLAHLAHPHHHLHSGSEAEATHDDHPHHNPHHHHHHTHHHGDHDLDPVSAASFAAGAGVAAAAVGGEGVAAGAGDGARVGVSAGAAGTSLPTATGGASGHISAAMAAAAAAAAGSSSGRVIPGGAGAAATSGGGAAGAAEGMLPLSARATVSALTGPGVRVAPVGSVAALGGLGLPGSVSRAVAELARGVGGAFSVSAIDDTRSVSSAGAVGAMSVATEALPGHGQGHGLGYPSLPHVQSASAMSVISGIDEEGSIAPPAGQDGGLAAGSGSGIGLGGSGRADGAAGGTGGLASNSMTSTAAAIAASLRVLTGSPAPTNHSHPEPASPTSSSSSDAAGRTIDVTDAFMLAALIQQRSMRPN